MGSERGRRTLYALCLLAIVLGATFLRFYRLDTSSLWSDEGNTWAMLGRTYGEIAAAAAADIHPPGYYWLLKLWSGFFGASAWAMRSFSAVTGVLLVVIVERIGRRIAPGGGPQFWLPLLAALAAAVHPLLVYYSQEARMYMLLALAGAGVFWALLSTRFWVTPGYRSSPSSPQRWGLPEGGYLVCAVVGLWTHYSFAIVLMAANLAWLLRWLFLRVRRAEGATGRALAWWIGLNLLSLLAFLPWLPTAVTSVLQWPKGGVAVGLLEGLEVTLRTLLFGPVRATPDPAWPWLLLGALLPLLGLAGLLRTPGGRPPIRWSALPLALWLGLPIALMAGLGLFTDAFLKFLITAAPAWCLLLACAPLLLRQQLPQAMLAVGTGTFAVVVAALVLPAYYGDAQARDNYQGIAAYVRGIGDPQQDLVILDAPGQQEVWRYYDPGLPVLPLPQTRPPVPADVESALAGGTAGRRNLYALFWATDEADPGRLVESWLDRNAFKALDIWQGNVRLATYALASDLQEVPLRPVDFGPAITLAGQAQPQNPQRAAPGNAVLVQLRWDVAQDVSNRYKVSLQVLDAANQVLAQRDGEPVGGSRPTDTWRAGEQILDNYALPVPLGTPPGEYRLLAAMYDAESGQRLTHAGGDSVELGAIFIEQGAAVDPALLPIQHRLQQTLGPVTLLGYDAYRKDFAHAPATPLAPGDLAHFVFYWRSPDPLPADWPADLQGTVRLGGQSTTFSLAGAAYPTGDWQPGEVLRGQVDLVYDGTEARPQLEVAGQTLTLAELPR
jgi:4-amino-4-deoxy-L-arabinose transferase-like glycosyltransferase